MRWYDHVVDQARAREREHLAGPEAKAALREALREAQRVLDEQPPLPAEEQAFVDRRRAEIRTLVEAELARRAGR